MPPKKNTGSFRYRFEKLSGAITRGTGSPGALITACGIIVLWIVTGPIFHFSDTWQLVINTGTTVITFVMVFIIQHSQNKDTTAIHLKLNELIASNRFASNRIVNVEDLTEQELLALKKFYITLSKLSAEGKDIFASHSIDEAHANTRAKIKEAKSVHPAKE
ncbi:low affinity iron permease family protein [Sediminibacterium soli]|uniref:low affinity iron permease family protein n=1 Tax=Sediminibacterium soli TaxID=2698829 RepID=UPI00137A10C0|nr:low affinity iron permease family protein [Sediminibacterium soli]NCI45906.1 low affinity iron permease family protein [Sediminibacterium soli]